jgi:thymidylate synthase
MAHIDLEFQKLCKAILSEGREYENKNRGVKRLQIPSYTFRHDLSQGFPAITNKELYWKGIVGELVWFLRGDTDIKYLNDNGIKIWNDDAFNWYVKKYSNNDAIDGQEDFYHKNEDGSYRMFTFAEFSAIGVGSVGQNYSAQWRNFNGNTDQIADLISMMKKDIMSSRLKVNAWNPSETNLTALPPCHSEFQVIGVPLTQIEMIEYARKSGVNVSKTIKVEELIKMGIPEFGFELHWNQRSVDTFLGLPFNIASYGLLANILELLTGYPALAIEGTLKCVHFYDNQYDAVRKLLERDPNTHDNCEVAIAKMPNIHIDSLDSIFGYMQIEDFKLVGYTSDEAIKVKMLAPKEL